MIPSFTPSQNHSTSPLSTHYMPPPPRPNPVYLVAKLAQRSINHQMQAINDLLWSPNELKWVAERLPSPETTFAPWNVEGLKKHCKTTKKRTIGPIKSRNSNLLWSSEEVKTLKALYKQRLSLAEIADQLGRSKSACSHKLWQTKPEGEEDRRVYNLTPMGRVKEKEAAIALTLLGK